MNLPEATEQSQARGEDGRFVSATPPTDAPQPGPDAGATTDATPTPAGVAPAGDVYDAVAQRMIAADKAAIPSQPAVAADRPSPTPATPDAALPGQTSAAAEANPPSSPEKPADPAAAAATAADLKAYGDTLSAREFTLLKRVPGMLPPSDEWRGMSVTERVEHMQDVRAILNQRNRQFQQTNDRGRQPQPPATDDRTTPETGQPPRAGGTGEGDGVPPRPLAQPAGQAATATPTLSADAMAALQQVAADFGEDSAVYRATLLNARQNAELTHRLEQQDRARQSDAQARAAERQIRSFEDAQFEQLKAKYPQLADPATRDQLREAARDFYALRDSQGRPVEDREALRFVTHNTLYPQIQAQQQQQAQAGRQRSLNGTFDRATPPVNPAAAARDAVSSDDVYASVAQGLTRAYASGLSGERAREAARTALAR